MPKLTISGWGFPWKGNAFQGGGFYGVLNSQAIRGGGFYGVLNSQSIQGGGSVSGVSAFVSAWGGLSPGHTSLGFFVKVASYPASDMTLVDLYYPPNGYWRIKMTSTGHIIAESVVVGRSTSIDLTGVGIATGGFHYVSNQCRSGSAMGLGNGFGNRGMVTKPDGTNYGTQQASSGETGDNTTYVFNYQLGWGVSLSSSYLNFPNTSGNELSKFEVKHDTSSNPGLIAPPGSDPSTSGLDVLYLCRDSAGSHATIVDSTANAYTLTAGVNGITVVTDGPYV